MGALPLALAKSIYYKSFLAQIEFKWLTQREAVNRRLQVLKCLDGISRFKSSYIVSTL